MKGGNPVVDSGGNVVWWEPSLTKKEAILRREGLVFNQAAAKDLPERIMVGIDTKKNIILITPHPQGIKPGRYGSTGKAIWRVKLVRFLAGWGFPKGKYLVNNFGDVLTLTFAE